MQGHGFVPSGRGPAAPPPMGAAVGVVPPGTIGVGTPGLGAAGVGAPGGAIPGVDSPRVGSPEVGIPGPGATEFVIPGDGTPGLGGPGGRCPDATAPLPTGFEVGCGRGVDGLITPDGYGGIGAALGLGGPPGGPCGIEPGPLVSGRHVGSIEPGVYIGAAPDGFRVGVWPGLGAAAPPPTGGVVPGVVAAGQFGSRPETQGALPPALDKHKDGERKRVLLLAPDDADQHLKHKESGLQVPLALADSLDPRQEREEGAP
ncbi:hypothetical protein DL768_004778 [Monosporascus sp. mg162]|nr:hypothetical protein DL768_004778 [Monosporascus sp. mg162]